ncbi:MAG: LysR family transcriptional regulator [Sphingomonas sp.]|nr:MAG: LysR family transcriptional regulator [Sphingomonas sp.]
MDIRQLRYFRAVADERSFTRAAERLNMAQPPLSKRIQELEGEIGAPLFERAKRPLKLTLIGSLLHEHACLVMDAMDRLQAEVRQATQRPRMRFTMGLVPSTLYVRFPDVVARFRECVPQIELRLAEMDSGEQVRALIDGRIDIGFDRIMLEDPLLHHEVMREENLVVALPADDPLIREERALSLAELATRPLILYPGRPRPSYADHVLAIYRQQGLFPASVLEVRELQTALVMVASGAGICMVPDSVTRSARPDISFAPLAEEATVPLFIRFRKHDRSPAFQALMRIYEELYREWGWDFPSGLSAAR